MAHRPDPTQMAQEFLKLWQTQMAAAMTDPQTVAATLQAMQGFYAPPGSGHDASARRVAAAPDAARHAIGDLARRLERLEQSVAAIAARLDAAENPARTKRRSVGKTVAGNQRPAKPDGKRVAAKRKPAKSKRKKK